MEFTKILTDGGAAAIVALLFILCMKALMDTFNKHLADHRSHIEAQRVEVKEMRQEHIAQVNGITKDFGKQLEDVSHEFRNGMEVVKTSIAEITREVREVKAHVSIAIIPAK